MHCKLFYALYLNRKSYFFFGPPCFSAKIELHFTLNYAAHVNQDVNRKSIYVSCFSWNPL